jgi:hypothetical protein
VSKCAKDAENVFAPLVIVSIGARKRTLAGKTVHQNGSIDATSVFISKYLFKKI